MLLKYPHFFIRKLMLKQCLISMFLPDIILKYRYPYDARSNHQVVFRAPSYLASYGTLRWMLHIITWTDRVRYLWS